MLFFVFTQLGEREKMKEVQDRMDAIRKERKDLVKEQRETIVNTFLEYLDSLKPAELLKKKLCINVDTGLKTVFEENEEFVKDEFGLQLSERVFNINLRKEVFIFITGEYDL